MNLPQDHVVDPERLFTGVDLNFGMPVFLSCACAVESQKYSLISLSESMGVAFGLIGGETVPISANHFICCTWLSYPFDIAVQPIYLLRSLS